ncbi:MAG: 1-acyl-sn-glycerol-3-phosphate acyltransferase [Planctomycetes bacterium]|nr:1-acyl-sn-glycerol-3-phosphate acyltransferase [Planctomycetota bacterium]
METKEESANAPPRKPAKTRPPAKLVGPTAGLLLGIVFRILYFILQIVLRALIFVKREGPSLPRGPVIVAPNHCSFMDPVVMQMSAWRQLSSMMTEIYYNPLWCRWFFQLFRSIPVKEGRGNREALSNAIDALRRGWAICIYPEGSIALDGNLQKFQPGIAALAAAAHAPVVPVAILGTFETFPKHSRFPKLWRRIKIRYGEPIPPPDFNGDDSTRREGLRSYALRIQAAVEKLQKE